LYYTTNSSSNNLVMHSKIMNFFDNINVDQIAFDTKFCHRAYRKVSPKLFLLSCFMCFTKSNFSLRQWAICLSQLAGNIVSHQSLDKKLHFNRKDFVSELVNKLCLQNLSNVSAQTTGILSRFNRVLVQDSTLVNLPQSHYGYSSGISNGNSVKAMGRIQVVFDLVSNAVIKMEKCTYTSNDRSYAREIIKLLNKGDLLLRDLGYFVTSVFKDIHNIGAFYISKLSVGICIFDEKTGEEIDLVKLIKAKEKKGIFKFDMTVLLNKKEKIRVRVFGYKVSAEQAMKKRQQQINSRHKDCTISNKSKFLANYNIYITNITEEEISGMELFEIYKLRWTIEIMFKEWKQNFDLNKLMYCSKTPSEARSEMLLNLLLLYILIITGPQFLQLKLRIYEKYGKHLSPIKFSKFWRNNYEPDMDFNQDLYLELLARFACYDKRTDRKSFGEVLDTLIILS